MKLKLALAGAALLGFLGVGLSMALESIDEEGGPVAEEDASFGDPFFEASAGEDDDRAGSAWFTTMGGGRRGR